MSKMYVSEYEEKLQSHKALKNRLIEITGSNASGDFKT